ncbi:MAG: hypothetical protein LBD25_01290 [Coriobacteriales bacterium]|jgi:hypothetical protein|nr:hypothetical protein [Coriobacteriales bacterium]
MADSIPADATVTIEGTSCRTGFYGDLYPLFDSVGDIGAITVQKTVVLDDQGREFRRVSYPGHDWVHSRTRIYSGGTVYCAESQWSQTRDYYVDPSNFEYYCRHTGIGSFKREEDVPMPVMDSLKLDELRGFGNKHAYNPFDQKHSDEVMKSVIRLPESVCGEGMRFYKVSLEGYFTSTKEHSFFVHDGKLLLVFYHDVGSENSGIREVLCIEVPDRLGDYFMGLMQQYPRPD